MSTKQCPNCAEEIQEEAINCNHCGELLDEQSEASPLLSEVEPKKKISKGFLAGMVLGAPLWVSIFSVAPLLASLLALLASVLGVLMFTKGQEKFRGIAVASLGALLLLIGGVEMNYALDLSAIEQEEEERDRFLAEVNELSREFLRQTYAQGMELLEEKDYEGALGAFEKVAYVDPNYENLPELVKEAKEAFEAQK